MISTIIQQWYEQLSFQFSITVPSVCCHFLLTTVSIITKLAAHLYNFSSSVITDKSNSGADRKDGTPSPYLNGPCSEGKIAAPFFFRKRREGMVYILCSSRTQSQRKCLFNINLFSFPGDKNEGYWKESCLVEEVITFFFRSQRNNAFIFPEMTQFALWYAPLNVTVGMSSPQPCFSPVKLPLSYFWFIWALISPWAKVIRVAPPYNDELKRRYSSASCPLLLPH